MVEPARSWAWSTLEQELASKIAGRALATVGTASRKLLRVSGTPRALPRLPVDAVPSPRSRFRRGDTFSRPYAPLRSTACEETAVRPFSGSPRHMPLEVMLSACRARRLAWRARLAARPRSETRYQCVREWPAYHAGTRRSRMRRAKRRTPGRPRAVRMGTAWSARSSSPRRVPGRRRCAARMRFVWDVRSTPSAPRRRVTWMGTRWGRASRLETWWR